MQCGEPLARVCQAVPLRRRPRANAWPVVAHRHHERPAVPSGGDFNDACVLAACDTVANGVLASLSRLGIPAIDGRAVLTPDDFWARDIHWRPSGHKKIGNQLGTFLAKLID